MFGKEHEDFLQNYLELPNGIPSHDTLQRVFVKQRFKDANIEITFLLNKKGKYCLNLENSYSLCFITEATFIKHSENEINLKYNLFDEKTNKIISLNEIIIIGEELC